MALSLEERKRKLIEDVCASCSGGGGEQVGSGMDPTPEGEGVGNDYDQLMKGLSKIRSAKRKKAKKDGP